MKIQKFLATVLIVFLSISAMALPTFATDTESGSWVEDGERVQVLGYISDADGNVVEEIVSSPATRWAPVNRMFTLSPGYTFTSYQYSGSAYFGIAGETEGFERGSRVNVKIQRASSIGGSRTTVVNKTIGAYSYADAYTTPGYYYNVVFTNTSSSTIEFRGAVVLGV